jgi:hypothetical protein
MCGQCFDPERVVNTEERHRRCRCANARIIIWLLNSDVQNHKEACGPQAAVSGSRGGHEVYFDLANKALDECSALGRWATVRQDPLSVVSRFVTCMCLTQGNWDFLTDRMIGNTSIDDSEITSPAPD